MSRGLSSLDAPKGPSQSVTGMRKPSAFLTATAFWILLGTGCNPIPVVNPESLPPQRKLKEADPADFQALLAGLGRIEQIARMITGKSPAKWAIQDETTNTWAKTLKSPTCGVMVDDKLSTKLILPSYHIQISGESCALQAEFVWQRFSTGGIQLRVSYAGNSDFASDNLVASLQLDLTGRNQVSNTAHLRREDLSLNAYGSGLDSNGARFSLIFQTQLSRSITGHALTEDGNLLLTLSSTGGDIVFETQLKRSVQNDIEKDQSVYLLNKAPVTRELFLSTYNRLGLLVGIPVLLDAP